MAKRQPRLISSACGAWSPVAAVCLPVSLLPAVVVVAQPRAPPRTRRPDACVDLRRDRRRGLLRDLPRRVLVQPRSSLRTTISATTCFAWRCHGCSDVPGRFSRSAASSHRCPRSSADDPGCCWPRRCAASRLSLRDLRAPLGRRPGWSWIFMTPDPLGIGAARCAPPPST